MPQRLDELLQECTVKITVPGQDGWGTGFFVATGLILTCAHVVQRSPGQVQIGWQNKTLDAVVERSIPDPYDLALLRVTLVAEMNPPCVWLDEEVQSRDRLYLFGYPDEGDRQGEPRTFNCDGLTGSEIPAILFNLGQVRPGMSGSPLLNQRTGKVCGIVKFTRDRSSDMGGGAIPTRLILAQFPELRELQREAHQKDSRWIDCLRERTTEPSQTVHGDVVAGDKVGRDKIRVQINHITQVAGEQPSAVSADIDFQSYLQAIITNEDYREWQEVYTPTTVEDRRRMPEQDTAIASQRRFSSRLKLRVETVKPGKQEQGDQPDGAQEPPEQVEQWDVLVGLRNYAADHVVLIGKPGSGKSTSLERLLLEEAEKRLQDPNARIPVLVKLRRCTGAIEGLIRDFLGLALEIAQIEELLRQGRFLLLLDGLNELPKAFETEVANFRYRYRRTTPMIVSTRDLGGGGTLGIEKTLKMLPLTESQMREFVRGYLGEEGDRLFQQLQADRLRKFAETPLLLWMLCRVFAHNGKVPDNLGLAFREFTQLHDQELQADAPAESKDQWPKLLRHLAFVMMQGKTLFDPELSISREEAEDCLTAYLRQEDRANPRECAERWLKDLLKYHLIQPVIQPNLEEHIEFRHQLIQEYYAAEYLLRLLPTLTDDQLKQDYLNYLKWTEPISLMLALVDEETQALRVVKLAMDDVDLMLGARLAGNVRTPLQEETIGWIDDQAIPIRLKLDCWATSHSEAALPGLLQALEDQDQDVCGRAVKALGNLGSEAAVPGLLQAFGNQYLDVRRSATLTLGNFDSEAAIPGLLQALEHQDWPVRKCAAEALGKLGREVGSEAVLPGLLRALEDQNWLVRWSATLTLGNFGSEAAIPVLLQALEHQDWLVRRRAAEVLGELGSEAALPGLLKALKHADSDVRRHGAEILGGLGSEAAISGLLKALEDQDSDVRMHATVALGKLGSEAALPGLLNALEHEDWDVRVRAAEVLGKLGSEAAIPVLLSALEHADGLVCMRAAVALGELGSKAAISDLLNSLQYEDWDVRSHTVEALGKAHSEASIPVLLQALEHEDWDVRVRAAEVLGELGSEAAIPGLLKVLEDKDSGVGWSAAVALGKVGSEAALPGLLTALKSKDWHIRIRAAVALGELGSEAAIPSLLKNLNDQDPSVRRRAANALGNLGSEAAIPGLLKALGDKDSDIRKHAAVALGKLGSATAMIHLWRLHLREPKEHLENAIFAIQKRCKFYNYDIFQGIFSQGETISLYFSYTPADAALQAQLVNHLTLLERQGVITSWSSHQIFPGDDRTQTIHQQLNTADIILLLISPDAIADDTCYHLEIQRAVERHQSGEARVIPILLRPVDWQGAPFSQLDVLPKNHQPVTTWINPDEAFQEIAAGIREIALELRRNAPQ